MLTAAAMGLAGYGLYSVVLGLAVLIAGPYRLEWWAGVALFGFGLLLTLSAPLVRVRFPGGLALAIGAMLGLQAFSLHNDMHFYGRIVPLFQVARGAFAALIVALAYAGQRTAGIGDRSETSDERRAPGGEETRGE
jgi:hypothetical protein